MELYTFIMDFRGGTYISQVQADNISESLMVWGKQLNPDDIQHLSEKGKQELIKELLDEEATPINTIKNVWFFCLSIRKGFIRVHVIKTSETEK